MYCPKCGSLIESNSVFCKNCGTKLHLSNHTSSSPKSKKAIAISLVIVVLFICSAIEYFRISSTTSFGYYDNNKWGISIDYFKKKYPDGYEYDKDPEDSKTTFSIPINSFEGLSFNSEETAACIFQDGKFYYVQILFRVDDAFSATDSLEEKLTKKYGTPAKYEPQYGSYRWDTSKSNITVTAISDTAVAVWFADIDSPYNPLNK